MAARTAVVAGTATAVSGRVQRRQAGRWQQQDEAATYEQQQAQPQYAAPPQYAPPAPAAAPAADPMAELQKLADMKTAGLLTDEEFTAMKAKIIAS
jgi:hypothetical protein